MLNLTAPINTMGYGLCSINILAELERLGAEPALFPIGVMEVEARHRDAAERSLARRARYHHDAPSVRIFHQFDLAQHVGRGKRAGFPIFELDRFTPTELHHLRGQDLLLVPSAWAKWVVEENRVGVRAEVVPLGVDPAVFRPAPLPDGPTRFLCVGKWELRKGMDVAVNAFARAFTPSDDVELVMHCHNPCIRDGKEAARYNSSWEDFAMSSPMACRTTLSRTRLPGSDDVAALMASAHCGLFLSRAEGWNLELGEMMAMGRQVITTACTAHEEFADASCARLVTPGPMEPAHDGVWFRSDNPEWGGRPGRWHSMGEAQVEEAAAHMRDVHRRRGINEGGIARMAGYTWGHSARRLLDAIA